MKKEELIAVGCMVPDTLQEAMRYSGREMKVIEGSREELVSFIYQLLRENGKENTYFDFYFGTLSKEEKQKALSVLSIEQASYLCGLNLPIAGRMYIFHMRKRCLPLQSGCRLRRCFFLPSIFR